MTKSNALLLGLLITMSTLVNAQVSTPKYYVELGEVSMKVVANGVNASPLVARLVVGREIDQTFSVEGSYMASVSDDTVSVGNTNVGVGLSSYGVYLKSNLISFKQMNLFGRLGYAHTRLTSTDGRWLGDSEDNSLSYGLGMQASLNKDWHFQSGYTVFSNKDGSKVKGFGLSLGYQF
jgi:Outer membrane protein beta-barrel domain